MSTVQTVLTGLALAALILAGQWPWMVVVTIFLACVVVRMEDER